MGKIEDYKAQVDQRITNQEDPNSIAPEVLGKTLNDLADIVEDQLVVGPTEDMGYASPGFDPGIPENAVRYQLEAGQTYPDFPDENGDPIVVPDKVGDEYVFAPIAYWETDHWVLRYRLMEIPGLDDLTRKEITKTQKSLFYTPDNASSISYNQITKILTWGVFYVFNGTGFIRVNAGSIDIGAALLTAPTSDFWYIYIPVASEFINGGSGSWIYEPGSVVIKEYNNLTISIRDENAIPLFYYNKRTNNITSPLMGDVLQTLVNLLTQQSNDEKKRLNNGKALYYAKGSATITVNKTDKTITTTGNLYVFNASYVSGSASYLRILPGVIDMSAVIAAHPADPYIYIYAKPSIEWFKNNNLPVSVNASDLIIKNYNEATIVDARSDNAILLFTYNNSNNRLSTQFMNEDLFEGLNGVSPSDHLKRFNSYKALNYSIGAANLTFDKTTKIITSSNSMYVFNGLYGVGSFIRVNAGSLNLTAALAAAPADNFFYIYAKPSDGWMTGDGTTSNINMPDLIIKSFNDATVPDVRSNNAILMFTYNRSTNSIWTPFLNDKIFETIAAVAAGNISEQIKTNLRLQFTGRGTISWDKTSRIVSWTNNQYIFNRTYVGSSAYIRLDIGSLDFGTYSAGFPADDWFVAYIVPPTNFINGATGGNNGNISIASIIIKSWSENTSAIREPSAIPIFYYNKGRNTITSPFLNELSDTKALETTVATAEISAWKNNYPNIYAKLPKFFKRYAGYSEEAVYSAEDKNRVLLLGNSIFSRDEHTSVLNIVPSRMPPALITKNVAAYLWENLKGNKPGNYRFDVAGRFTETGAWVSAEDLVIWDDAGDINNITRRSTDSTAKFTFSIDINCNYFNLIDRMDSEGQQDVTVAITAGNGVVQVRLEGNDVWSEANGFVFSQRNGAPSTAAGLGNTKYQRRVEFKKVNTGVDVAQTITISKGTANTEALMYWGIEEVTGNKMYNQIINVARGGHTLSALKNYVVSDVAQRKPNLVVLEIPLLNMLAANSSLDYTINEIHDFVWGDRDGELNANSLKNLSSDWSTFEVLLIIPHHSRVHFNVDNTFALQTSGYTAEELYNAVKGFISYKGDVPFIDLSTAFMAEVKADPLFNGNYYSAFTSSGITGTGYFNDTLHPNNKGTLVWAKNLVPVFYLNTM